MEEAGLQPVTFEKYHGLGNDYLVVEPNATLPGPVEDFAREICDRHYGVGGDGLLFGPFTSSAADFGLRIFNPDGSEAEKSGNGLRIFARYLWETKRAGAEPFTIAVPGGIAGCQVFAARQLVQVEMGRPRFDLAGSSPEAALYQSVVDQLQVNGRSLRVCIVSLGNPHCVVLDEAVSPEGAQELGPQIERHERFPQRTNVQFLQVLDRENLRIEIWERGAGYTLASGSSACAAASAAYRLGLCAAAVQVHMPGGTLQVIIGADGETTLTGSVVKVCAGKYWPRRVTSSPWSG